jgi:hypothetical protein
VPAAVIVVSRRATFVEPLRAACIAAGLDVDVGRAAGEAAAIARVHAGADEVVIGVVVDVDDVGLHVAPLCDELRLIAGLGGAPIVLLGAAGGPLSSMHAALDVGADAFFALPVETALVVAKLLAYRAMPLAGPLPTTIVPRADVDVDDAPRAPGFGPAFATAATPDELLAALESTDVVGRDDDVDDSDLDAVSGPCAPGGVAALLWAMHVRRRSGTLEFLDAGGVRRACTFVDGAPIRVRSTAAAERADTVLVRLGWATASRVAAALGAGDGPLSLRALCTSLVDAGGLLPEERRDAVRDVLREQLGALVVLQDAAWQFRDVDDGDDDEQEEGVAAGDHVAALIIDVIRRRFDRARLYAAVGGPQSVLAPVDERDDDDDDDDLDLVWRRALHPDEARALASFNGDRTVDDVVVDAGVVRDVALRAALLGRTFGVLRTVHRAQVPAVDSEEAGRARATATLRERVFDRLARARGGDPRHLLSVTTDATAVEIVAAATTLRARFDPARAEASGLGDLRDTLVEIVAAVDAAEANLLRRL